MSDRPEVDLRLLRTFVTLAEELSFRRAAERLNLTQPALSTQLRRLETRLGLALFHRSTRRVDLTSAGVSLLTPARALLAESNRFGDLASQLRSRRRVRLIFGAALYTLGIPERQLLLEAFLARSADAPFTVTPQWQRNMARALLRDRADLALMLGVAVPAFQWEAERTAEVVFPDTLRRLVLGEQRVALLVPRLSPLAAFDEIPPGELRGLDIAMLGPTHGSAIIGPIQNVLGRAGARLVVPPEPHGIGVERYGRQFQIPAVSLGWFGGETGVRDDMVRRPVKGLEIRSELALLRSAGRSHPLTEAFWREALDRFPEAREVAGAM
jgi:DNA-binding transcriptional LysR family regulator